MRYYHIKNIKLLIYNMASLDEAFMIFGKASEQQLYDPDEIHDMSKVPKREDHFTDKGLCKRCGGKSIIPYRNVEVCTNCGHAVHYSDNFECPIIRCPKHGDDCVLFTKDGAKQQTFKCGMVVNFD